MEYDKLTLRDKLKVTTIVHWVLFKEALIRAVYGIFFLCIFATCVGLYYGEDAMSFVGKLWLLELYLSLFAIGLYLFKRFVFDRYMRNRKS